MMSNLANQMKEQGVLDRIDEVFQEIPRVRRDLGYPPLVTPTSQIVGTQAVVNVVTGEHYQTITNEVKRYLQGGYGRAPGEVNARLRAKAIGNEALIDVRPADLLQPEMDKLRGEIADSAKTEEDVLIYAMFPDIGKTFLEQREQGTLQPEPLLAPKTAAIAPTPMATQFKISLHGETYDIHLTGAGAQGQQQRHIFLTVDGVPEDVIVQPLDEYDQQGAQGRPAARTPGDVTTSMPGNVIEVAVREGDRVAEGDLLLVIEAMKMETEINAPIAGTVAAVHVQKGDRIIPGETLIQIRE